ncbi:hypothetical protein BGX20_007279 [Mortierella sp. AD010]|nr:hypothetical protein BGX20_007279 [Mortierella sp. AD010]
MGYPSKSLESFYRNSMSDVERFLDSRHEEAYKVYNLCSERSYSDQRFHGRVAQFPFPDHSPPPFQLIHPFCEDVSDWLHTTPGNVVAVHCKAGKGRTGVMICSFLVHCGATAEEAIKLYAEKRTLDGCGVTIPSQIRYIQYYEQFLESRTLNYDPRLLSLHEIVIDTIPKPLLNLESGSNCMDISLSASKDQFCGNEHTSLHEFDLPCHVDQALQQLRISISDKIVLGGDVKMTFWYDSLYKRRHLCHFSFNTTFIDKTTDTLDLTKSEVDKACKDKLHSIFDKNFHISVKFSPALAQQSPLPTLDSLPNRKILLKYKNHNGPNSVQVSPPFFSSVRLPPARNKTSLAIFGIGMKKSSTDEDDQAQTGSPPSSNGSNSSFSSQQTSNKNGPVLVHSNKPAFKPVWNDKDRDRDDNWDAASISSDFSESDSILEWWYTKPPRPTIQSSAGIAAGTVSASIVQPETIIRTDPETKGSIFAEVHEEDTRHDTHSPLPPHLQSMLAASGCNGSGGAAFVASASIVASMAPSSAYRSPPHSATSPLAREVKFDTLDSLSRQAIKSRLSLSSRRGSNVSTESRRQLDSNENDSLAGSYLNEEGEPIDDDDDDGNDDNDEGRDSGIGNDDSKFQDREHERERERQRERERGWVDSVSRWFWSADGSKGQQEPNGTERL